MTKSKHILYRQKVIALFEADTKRWLSIFLVVIFVLLVVAGLTSYKYFKLSDISTKQRNNINSLQDQNDSLVAARRDLQDSNDSINLQLRDLQTQLAALKSESSSSLPTMESVCGQDPISTPKSTQAEFDKYHSCAKDYYKTYLPMFTCSPLICGL